MKWLDEFVNALEASGLAKATDLVGCSEDELLHIESTFEINLPKTYRAFMLKMGRAAGSFHEKSEFLYPAPMGLHDYATEFLARKNLSQSMKVHDFVFFVGRGKLFLYFDTSLSQDDPPTFCYREDDREPFRNFPSFTTFLRLSITDYHGGVYPSSG